VRLTHKEFWQTWVLYAPVLLAYPYWALRAKSVLFFTAANPDIETGGLLGESKAEIGDNIPRKYRPKSALLLAKQSPEAWYNLLKNNHLEFPLIAKPTVGGRGLMVEKIESFPALQAYLQRFKVDFLIEEFIDAPLEATVLYWKNPVTQESGILSIALKKLLTVRGDNRSSVRALLSPCFRGKLQIERLEKEKPDLLNTIPNCGEIVLIEPIGNHCRGTLFLNANNLITADMVAKFDTIQAELPRYNIFRIDLKVPSQSDLQQGRNIKILEINGVGSEPAHIYDPEISLLQIWRDTYKLWQKIYEIGTAYHQLGVPYQPFSDFKIALSRQKAFEKAGKN
jgi:hypothetical protein